MEPSKGLGFVGSGGQTVFTSVMVFISKAAKNLSVPPENSSQHICSKSDQNFKEHEALPWSNFPSYSLFFSK